MELWDAYDKSFIKISGLTLIRGKEIPKGVYHLVCDVLVQHEDGTYLLMKRDLRKTFGGMWEATAGGSALVGEKPLECAKRELVEETGIIADELIEVGRCMGHHEIYVECLCVTNWDKNQITLQEGETIAYQWVERDMLRAMNDDELVTERIQKFIHELNSWY